MHAADTRTKLHTLSSARVSHLVCPRVLKHNPTQHHTFGLTLPRLALPPPLYTTSCVSCGARSCCSTPCARIGATVRLPVYHCCVARTSRPLHPSVSLHLLCPTFRLPRLAFLMLRFAPPQVLHTLFSGFSPPSCIRDARPYLFHTLCHRAPPGLSLHGTCLWLALVSIPPHGMSSLYQSSHTLTGALTHTALHRSIHFSHASPPLHHNPALNLLRPASCSRCSSHYGHTAVYCLSLTPLSRPA